MSYDWTLHVPPEGELRADVWYCGDECGCSQARISVVLARNSNGYPIEDVRQP